MNKITSIFFYLFFSATLYSANSYRIIPEIDPNGSIEIFNISTNGLILSNNTISFNGVDDLEIEFDIKTTYTGSDGNFFQGNSRTTFFEPNEFDNEEAEYYNNGVSPLFLFNKFLSLNYDGTSYSTTYRQKLRFKRNTVYNTGCSIVFKYGTTTGPDKILKKLTYKLIDGTKTGNESYKTSTANVNLTNISYSDGSPIVNNKIIVPDFDGDEIGTTSINLSFNYNCTYGTTFPGSSYYPGFVIQIARDQLGSTNLTNWEYPIYSDGTLTFNNIKIKSSDISPSTKLRILFNFQEQYLDLQFATIKGNSEKPILNNIISDNQTTIYGQTAKPFTVSSSPYVDFTIPCNYRGCVSNRDYRYITTFKWQTRTQNSNWSDIPGATNQEYSPTKNFTENTYYRRLAFYNIDQYSISNISSIIIEGSNITNYICCDQSLQFKNSQPQTITGNDINSNLYSYQWQSAKNSRGTSFQPWHDVVGATSQNYTHVFPEDAATNEEKTRFRRIAKLNLLPISISNSIIISRYTQLNFTSSTKTSSLLSQSLTSEPIENNYNNLSIYPNPIVDNLQIEGSVDINSIQLYDSLGIKKNIDKKQKSENLIEINTTHLSTGVYLLKIDNSTFSKTLIKN